MSVFCAYLSDKYKQRGATAVLSSLIAIPGYAIFLGEYTLIVVSLFHSYRAGTSNKHANYGALFLQIVGVYCVPPCLGTWNANNVQPHYRRATGVAIGFMFTNAGGAFAPFFFFLFN